MLLAFKLLACFVVLEKRILHNVIRIGRIFTDIKRRRKQIILIFFHYCLYFRFHEYSLIILFKRPFNNNTIKGDNKLQNNIRFSDFFTFFFVFQIKLHKILLTDNWNHDTITVLPEIIQIIQLVWKHYKI